MDTPIVKVAKSPASEIGADGTVQDAVNVMVSEHVGAVAVMDDGTLVGIFTERDLMKKIVHAGRIAGDVPIRDVMEAGVVCISSDSSRGEALNTMLEHRFRHLPVTDDSGHLVGMLSLRRLLSHQVKRLKRDVHSLEQYLAADGPGG
jgi:CBS domain-containing protein